MYARWSAKLRGNRHKADAMKMALATELDSPQSLPGHNNAALVANAEGIFGLSTTPTTVVEKTAPAHSHGLQLRQCFYFSASTLHAA
jgi:hypothetical protein